MGTRNRKSFDPGYYREVLRIEKTLRRAICAAEKPDFTPCKKEPNAKYGDYCFIHKGLAMPEEIRVTDASSQTHGLTKNKKDLKIMTRNDLLMQFPRCNNCPLRADACELFTPDKHCLVQENFFYKFVDLIRFDHDIYDMDLFTLYDAALNWSSSKYYLSVKNQWSPTSDEAILMQIASVRESKEFRSCMKALGLTREQRKRSQASDATIGIQAARAAADIDLSQVMAEIASKSLQQLGQERNHQIEKRKKIVDVNTHEAKS